MKVYVVVTVMAELRSTTGAVWKGLWFFLQATHPQMIGQVTP